MVGVFIKKISSCSRPKIILRLLTNEEYVNWLAIFFIFYRLFHKMLYVFLPLNEPTIAPMQRTIATRERDDIEVSKTSHKSKSVGPKIDPHNP